MVVVEVVVVIVVVTYKVPQKGHKWNSERDKCVTQWLSENTQMKKENTKKGGLYTEMYFIFIFFGWLVR